ncbi:hypothetical protein [Sporosarcina jiandibaonis]|uniref:hypothetical protein n=1 Tax=Sporosarcina jiandibaonis TaxID=2715535 RepID=UPI001551DF9E|nr:hypothetical protein [Sporosarcina jiandibaonis]
MLKKGRFALSNSKEYELASYQGQYYLKSNDSDDLKNGFIKMRNDENIFIKNIDIDELEDAYEVFPYAMVKGHRFAVEGYNKCTAMVSLVTNNPFVKNKLPVRPYGKSEYIIEIPYTALEIKDDRIPILGFEKDLYERI